MMKLSALPKSSTAAWLVQYVQNYSYKRVRCVACIGVEYNVEYDVDAWQWLDAKGMLLRCRLSC